MAMGLGYLSFALLEAYPVNRLTGLWGLTVTPQLSAYANHPWLVTEQEAGWAWKRG